jgi:hypothetical protein
MNWWMDLFHLSKKKKPIFAQLFGQVVLNNRVLRGIGARV